MLSENQMIWPEIREDDGLELFYVMAERHHAEWRFFERSASELRWYPVPSTDGLVKRAITEGARPTTRANNSLQMKQVA